MRSLSWQKAALALLTMASAACVVRKDEYDRVVADAAKASAAAEAKQKTDQATIDDLGQRLAAAEKATQEREASLSELTTSAHNVQAQLDEATAINQQLRGELQRLGKDVDKILAERGTLAKALDDAKARLGELRQAQTAAESRAALFRELAQRFKSLTDAGQIRIEARRGRVVMEVSGDLLFEANHADVKAAGKGALMEIAHTLGGAGNSGRRYLVTAHVDDEPLKSKRYKTTWELTTDRAVAVVEYLVSLGMKADSLTAAGAGLFDPLVPNDSPASRARNRCVEIALMPSPDETINVTASR